jgi:Conjugal transfer protein TraD
MVMNEHTPEQGSRVHHLINLGGLIAVAGLDREPPDFLLGALVSIAQERADLTSEQ